MLRIVTMNAVTLKDEKKDTAGAIDENGTDFQKGLKLWYVFCLRCKISHLTLCVEVTSKI